MQDLMAINVVIGDRTYRIKIEPKDEEAVRRTLKAINDKIIEYKTQFAGRDMQDYIAMVLIWLATEQPMHAVDNEGIKEIYGKLRNLQQIIEEEL